MKAFQRRRRQFAQQVRRQRFSEGRAWGRLVSVHRNGRDYQLKSAHDHQRDAYRVRALLHGGTVIVSVDEE